SMRAAITSRAPKRPAGSNRNSLAETRGLEAAGFFIPATSDTRSEPPPAARPPNPLSFLNDLGADVEKGPRALIDPRERRRDTKSPDLQPLRPLDGSRPNGRGRRRGPGHARSRSPRGDLQ